MDKKAMRFLAAWNMSFHWFIIGIIIPVMVLYLMEKGLSLAQVGIALASYSAATVLLELPTGGLADSIGRVKVYTISLLFQILGALVLLLMWNFQALIVCFAFQGVARSLSSGTMDAHFVDQFYKLDPQINLQEEMARIGTFVPVGLGLGTLLGGFLPMTLGNITINTYLESQYAGNYIIMIIALLIQIVTTLIFIKEDKREQSEAGLIYGFKKVPQVVRSSITYGIKHPVVLIILIAGFVWGFSISGLETFWQPQVKSIIPEDMGSWIYGLLMTGYFLAAALGNMLATPLCKLFKNNYPLVLFVSRLLMGALYFILAFQTGLPTFAVFYLSLFLFNGIQNSPQSSLFNGAIPSEQRSTLMSFASVFLQSGGILGSLLLGFTSQHYSISTSWVIASIVIAVSALLYLLIPIVQEKREVQLNREF